MLHNRADYRTIAYMAVATLLPLVQWSADQFHPPLFCASLVMAFTVSVMHHNHQHSPLWKWAWLNHATDFWFTLFQGHPGFVFGPSHRDNHHVHHNGALDYTRTWLKHDGNSLIGFIAHPVQFAVTILPLLLRHIAHLWRTAQRQFWMSAAHYMFLTTLMTLAFHSDWSKTVLFLLLPQLTALFFLLGSNYLQHAHTDGGSEWNHSRNFLGLINPLCFNIGYHTAHHQNADLHWSELPAAHARIARHIDQRLIEPGFGRYCLRTFIAGPLLPHLRSQPWKSNA